MILALESQVNFHLSNARTPKSSNTLDIGVKQIYQGAWNNVEGCKDAYCTQIYSAISDSATFRNPYTGEVIPMREHWIGRLYEGSYREA